MKPTALIYSAHDRCEYIHRSFIIERALQSWHNKTLMHLPMSQRSRASQEWDYNNFRWYYDRFGQWGLQYFPFYWDDHLRREDIDLFFHLLWSSEVVVLGGGNSSLGLGRYKALGDWYYNDHYLFERILHERQDRGLLTVGFSAGADQLGQYLCEVASSHLHDPHGFGLARNVVTTLHFEHGREGEIWHLAGNLPHCMVFGLPNDSGIGTHQFYLPSGNIFQAIWFITDNSWDVPQHQFHIKTRQGVKIQHVYNDGRHWSFNGGDMMVRVMSQDNLYQDITVITNQGQYIDYWTQWPSEYHSIEQIMHNN
ncbi:MAG: hypothetical protein RDV48_19690 [Candidatus Eremiobacteraeota bacterium]|nr:hypothetical protein [Candidatus Eremiobacteraeota bacterium]